MGLSVFGGEPPHSKKQGDGAAMRGQAAFPGHEYLPEASPGAEIIIRLIEYAVPETGAYDGADQKGVEKRVQKLLRNAFAAEEPAENIPADNEAGNEQQ